MNYAKKHMLVGPSRGSSAGSLVCYLTRITEIDPIPPGLYFERFIDESRTDLPDVDADFPGKKRHLVFKYMEDKYGKACVGHIGTVSKYQAVSALKKVCKRLGVPPIAITQAKTAMIKRSSGDARASDCLLDTLNTTGPGKKLLQMYPDVIRAAVLEGHAQHSGVHAAGLIVCNDPLENYCTVMADGTVQLDKKDAEKLGLLKIDVLGLRTLDILEDAGIDIPWYELKFDDPETYKVFNDMLLSGIFQYEGQSMRNLSRQINFKEIDQIDIVIALARPGPFGGGVTAEWMKRQGGKKYEPLHPVVAKFMDRTYGLPVYQEQTLAIVREIGKFDWGRVTDIRKAMSKRKGKEFFNKYWDEFKEGAAEQGIPEDDARHTWDLINAMGAWQMNKAHTYSYAVLSYWTAYLKAHHPIEFAAANMRNAKDQDTALSLLQEMVREGLNYEPFHALKSQPTWSVQGDTLVAGFDSLHGFGKVKSKKFAQARDKEVSTRTVGRKTFGGHSNPPGMAGDDAGSYFTGRGEG